MNHRSRLPGRMAVLVILMANTAVLIAADKVDDRGIKHESFDRDPGWIGVNNRSATMRPPVQIRQDFGFSSKTANVSGRALGEIGGLITPAGEGAYYGRSIEPVTAEQKITASGRLRMGKGGTNLLLGFFNSGSLNEWRTPNTIAIRLNGRGDKFFAYVEYCTSKWRAGGDSTPFPSTTDPKTGRWNLIGYPVDESLSWSLTYDPEGNNGNGVITATIGNDTAICKIDEGHKGDGMTFDRFGIMNVMKSADSGSEAWFDDISINGGSVETFDQDSHWVGRNNRKSWGTRMVRPWFDFGFSETGFAGGIAKGELGGQIFRGDCREVSRMACYGDRLENVTLDRPLRASGKVAMTRGVTDSTMLFGFYHSEISMRLNESQNDGVPESVLGIHIEGPSREGFRFYPVVRPNGRGSSYGRVADFSTIYPDQKSHDWAFEYDPARATGHGQVKVTFDGKSASFDLHEGDKATQTTFDRFGIITSWIDGNGQNVYLDDLSYTVIQR